MLHDCQLVHPVHKRVALFNNALEVTPDAGDQFITCEKVRWIYRFGFRAQKVGFYAIFPVFDTIDETVFIQLLHNPRTFPAVKTQLFPEFALEHTFRS